MRKFVKQLTFDTTEYEDFDELVEELFWNDMYLHQEDTIYIYDTSEDIWYSVEMRYHYADIMYLFEHGKTIRFDEVIEEEYITDLMEVFYGE